MKIAQRFSAGSEPGTVNKSVKRTTERYRAAGFRLSRPLRGLYESLCPWIPPMNRWAIFIRRLRRLLQQSALAIKNEPNHPAHSTYAVMRVDAGSPEQKRSRANQMPAGGGQGS